jgi:hypothetical protein
MSTETPLKRSPWLLRPTFQSSVQIPAGPRDSVPSLVLAWRLAPEDADLDIGVAVRVAARTGSGDEHRRDLWIARVRRGDPLCDR